MAHCEGWGSVAPVTHYFLYTITQIQILANTLLCLELSSTGIFSVGTFCIWGFHKLLSKYFQLYSIYKYLSLLQGIMYLYYS